MDDAKPDKTTIAATRADSFRERFGRSRAIAAQAARARTAGRPPNAEEAARLVAEYRAQGGQVTACPPADQELPVPGNKR